MPPIALCFGLSPAAEIWAALAAAWTQALARWARERDLQRFQDLLAELDDEHVHNLHSSFATLAAFDDNPQLRAKRDACAAELTARVASAIPWRARNPRARRS